MNKIVILVLILIAVVFAVFVAGGTLSADQPRRRNSSDSEAAAKDLKPPGWSRSIDRLFGGWQETVELRCEQKPAGDSQRRCDKLPLGDTPVAPAKKPFLPFLGRTEFRTVRLVRVSGQSSIVYVDKLGGGGKIDNPQKFDLPNPDNENSTVESLVVLEEGGTLNISCKGNAACQVGQQ